MEYIGPQLEMAFNAHYILDVLNVLPSEMVSFAFSDPKNSMLLSAHNDVRAILSQYVVMPLRL